ncbi:pre-mRNA-splicing factor 18 isoform X2 [Saccopteryx leptura]|uniref:pre-mRNA-splicing factor 18 isoform X2 n=1 Tax=Saccopteryx leptura TaxID=249018 RepID=UPI00339CA8F3
MDILKSEILRKRQLVEDRNLLNLSSDIKESITDVKFVLQRDCVKPWLGWNKLAPGAEVGPMALPQLLSWSRALPGATVMAISWMPPSIQN